MAYSISGRIYDTTGNVVVDCYYQFLFIKVNSSSSNNTWSDIYQTDSNGYFSKDILDGDILGAAGNFSENDEILISAWLGDSTRSLTITTFGDWIHTIEDRNKEYIVQNLQIDDPHNPISFFTGLPSDGDQGISYSMVNDSTSNISWDVLNPVNTKMYQHCTYGSIYGIENIFEPICIHESIWDYSDGPSQTFPGKVDGNHIWNNVGTYTVTLKITNNAGLYDTYSEQINIRYSIIVDFIFNPNPGILTETVDFTNTTSDPGNLVGTGSTGKEYVWEFYDGDILAPPSDTYEGNYSYSPQYIFHSFPDRVVVLHAHWYDGVSDRVSSVTKIIPFLPYCDFVEMQTDCGPNYRDISQPGLPPIIYHWWRIDEETPTGWNNIAELEGDTKYSFRYIFPHTGKFRIYHKIEDTNNLTDEEIKEYIQETCPIGSGSISAGGSGGHWYSPTGPGGRERPTMKIEFKKKKDKDKVDMTLKYVKRRGNHDSNKIRKK